MSANSKASNPPTGFAGVAALVEDVEVDEIVVVKDLESVTVAVSFTVETTVTVAVEFATEMI